VTGSLVVVPYDPAWPDEFERIRNRLLHALVDIPVAALEHVGSTAVRGMAAKPVIDIDVVVARQYVDGAIAALEKVGYAHLGDLGVPDRHVLRAPDDLPRQNVYVIVEGCLALRNHLGVRDALRVRPDLRAQYSTVKLALAARTDDLDVYVAGKTGVLLRVLRTVGLSPVELAELERINGLQRINGLDRDAGGDGPAGAEGGHG
jgi:GrpB-like predicted nucleotidyltransferase (UPF0157 family)